jgi:hypothetical protein
MLKRSRKDLDKSKYLIGSDKKLYECLEGEVAGAVVGEQMEKKGRTVFRFHKAS